MSVRVIWHEHRARPGIPSMGIPSDDQTLCGGQWYVTGEAPCEIEDAQAAADMRELPGCEVDDADIAAMRELLAVPEGATICRFKGRASWQDKVVDPAAVQTMAQTLAQLQQLGATQAIVHPSDLQTVTALLGGAPAASGKAIRQLIENYESVSRIWRK